MDYYSSLFASKLNGGGGGGVTVEPLTVTENGTYTAPSGKAYSPVNVGVPVGWTSDDVATKNYSGDIVLNTATSVKDWAFNSSSITSVSSNTVTEIKQQAFSSCTSLVSANFPNLNGIINGSAFSGDVNLESVNIPNINYFNGGYIFANCSKLTQVMMPNYSHNGSRRTSLNVFEKCTLLNTVDFGKCTGIDGNCFVNCANLKTLILRYTSVCGLGNTSAFNGTPFASGGSGGTIYVPTALLSSYPTATNWSTLNGYGTITWKAIEGSAYE